MDIQQFLSDYRAFRKENPFQENPDEQFITLKGKTKGDGSQGLIWSNVVNTTFRNDATRYPFLDGNKRLWLFKKEKDDVGTEATFGIVFLWDIRRIVKELIYDPATDILSITITKSASYWRFDSTNQVSVMSSFSNYTNNVIQPAPGVSKNMDSQSPVHPPTGIMNMQGPFV